VISKYRGDAVKNGRELLEITETVIAQVNLWASASW